MSTDPIPAAPFVLTATQARVLGALVEKEVTTPEYYPLSLNALINACNQRSNREPVMNLDEEAARMALHRLEDLRLAGRARRSYVSLRNAGGIVKPAVVTVASAQTTNGARLEGACCNA